jgi:integrase
MILNEGVHKVTLPYLHEFKDRHGVVRRYVRRFGKRQPLRADLSAPEFVTEYQAALELLQPGVAKPAGGTWHALVTEYLGSAQFKQLKATTQAENRREAERIRARWGKHPVNRLEPRHILKWQDELADTPGKANNMLACLKMLLTFGKRRGYTHRDPAEGVDELAGGSYRSWTDSEIASFEAKWPRGSRERLIFDLALNTGQRRGDLAAMTRHHIDGDVIGVAQEKTGERVAIPMHPHLRASLAAFDSKGISLLQRTDGTPLKVRELNQIFAAAVKAAIGKDSDCVLHGLRYSAARRLAEAGATAHEIMAVTGHRTLGMVEKYTREANKVRLANSAIAKLTVWRTRTERESGKPGPEEWQA